MSVTCRPVRTGYKAPDDPDVLPPADVLVVAPAPFNTVNKITNGISDTRAVGLVCEALGYGVPVVLVPWMNRGLVGHGAYRRSLDQLRVEGSRLVLTPHTTSDAGPERLAAGQLLGVGGRAVSVHRVFGRLLEMYLRLCSLCANLDSN